VVNVAIVKREGETHAWEERRIKIK